MRLPSAPRFAIGPDVSSEIVGFLSSRPHASEREIAAAVGADVDHPFFRTDLEVARAWVQGDVFPEHRVRAMEREQRCNVMVSIALRAAEISDLGGSVDPDEAERIIPAVIRLSEANVPIEHLGSAVVAMGIAERIVSLASPSEAGEMRAPIETLLRDYLKLRPDGLSDDRSVDEEAVKKVLSDSAAKEGPTHRVEAGGSIGPIAGVSTEGTSDGRPELEGEAERPP